VTGAIETIEKAAEAVASADALLVGAGAGMGVDSGLPDFRGDRGFWKAYPPLAELGIRFVEMANPQWFHHDPALAWGFYGHRLALYRSTRPHDGFRILRRWGESMSAGMFVFTSNVDGQFQAGGYGEGVVECHGSIHHLQCSDSCGSGIWNATDVQVDVDESTFRAADPLPACPRCGGVARPNILMFGDWGWIPDRTGRQEARFRDWLAGLRGRRLVVVECGAGTAVPTVRGQCEWVAGEMEATLVRINPRESHGPSGTASLPMGALEAIRAIDAKVGGGR
jgi:NAD-dependent SIR2 family protein deacetylase